MRTSGFHNAREDSHVPSWHEPLEVPACESYEEACWREAVQVLTNAIATLGEPQRNVLSLYYYEHLNPRQISRVLGLTEAHVSELRTAAILELREYISG